MSDYTDRQVVEETQEQSLTRVTKSSRSFPFVVQFAGIAVLFAATLLGLAWWQTGSAELVRPWLRGQRLLFEPMRIDFEKVPKRTVLEKPIRVLNRSLKQLTLLGSQPSCMCISLDDFPIVVPPGKEHQLKIKIGTSANTGPFEYTIKFFSDEPGYSSVVVTVSGSVQ